MSIYGRLGQARPVATGGQRMIATQAQAQTQAPAQAQAQPQTQAPAQPQTQMQQQQQPSQMFPAQFTQQAGNLAAALAMRGHNDYYTQNAQQGFGAGTGALQWGMGRDMGADMANAAFAPQQIGMQHQFANAQQSLQQQQTRDQEALEWGRMGLQNQQAANQLGTQQQGNLLQFLLGAAGNMGG